MLDNEREMIEKSFGVDPDTGKAYSDGIFDFWEGLDCDGEEIIVCLSSCEFCYKEDMKWRKIN